MISNNLKILIYGEPYDWAMAVNLMESFKLLNHSAKIFDYTKYMYRTKKFNLYNRFLDRVLYLKISNDINYALLNEVKKEHFDILVVLKGVHISRNTLSELKNRIKYIVNWNPDDFFNPLNSSRQLLDCFNIYDCIFSPREHLFEEYRKFGAKNIKLLNWYYLPKYEINGSIDKSEYSLYESSIVFIGTWSKRREKILTTLMNFENVKIFGNGWNKASSNFQKKINCNQPVFADEMSKIMFLSKININILTIENRDTTNLRNFEIPAFKGFQIAEETSAIKKIFKNNEEIVLYNSPDELAEKCQYYLKNVEAYDKIKKQGYETIVNGKNTILDRAYEIIETIAEIS